MSECTAVSTRQEAVLDVGGYSVVTKVVDMEGQALLDLPSPNDATRHLVCQHRQPLTGQEAIMETNQGNEVIYPTLSTGRSAAQEHTRKRYNDSPRQS